jgi:predicted ArsR family transcriptional regulator
MKIDEIDIEMIDFMARRGKTKAGELADLVGITVPSIRVRLLQLMAKGVVSQERTRDHQVWFFVRDDASTGSKEKEKEAVREHGNGMGIDIRSNGGARYVE